MDLQFDKITMIRMRLWVLDIIHHAAFNKTAKCNSLHAPKYTLKYTPSLLDLRSQLSSEDARKYTASTLPSTPPTMFSSTLQGMLARTLTLALNGTQPACLTVHSHTSAQEALKHTPEHALKYASNCTRWYTPSLLGSTLPSTLSRGKTLPISLDYMLTWTLLHARSRDLLSCRRQAPGGVSSRRRGETAVLEGRELIINTPPQLSRHPKGICENEQFWLEERRKRVRRYNTTWPWESTRLRGSMKSRKEQVKAKSGKDRLCNSWYVIRWYMMRFHLPRGLPKIYSPSLHPSPLPLYLRLRPSPSPSHCHPCISVHLL